jgi:hypothetical protein
MKVKVNIHEFLEENASTYNGQLRVTANIGLDDLFDEIPEDDEIDVDIDELLAEHRQIANIWGTDDVRRLRPDLDDDQAWKVLQAVADRLGRSDCNVGITCGAVETVAAELFPQPEGPWQGRIDVSVANYTREAAIEHFEAMAELIERESANSMLRAVFDPASLRLLDSDETAGA